MHFRTKFLIWGKSVVMTAVAWQQFCLRWDICFENLRRSHKELILVTSGLEMPSRYFIISIFLQSSHQLEKYEKWIELCETMIRCSWIGIVHAHTNVNGVPPYYHTASKYDAALKYDEWFMNLSTSHSAYHGHPPF